MVMAGAHKTHLIRPQSVRESSKEGLPPSKLAAVPCSISRLSVSGPVVFCCKSLIACDQHKKQHNHWIGLRENRQETMVFTIKYRAFL